MRITSAFPLRTRRAVLAAGGAAVVGCATLGAITLGTVPAEVIVTGGHTFLKGRALFAKYGGDHDRDGLAVAAMKACGFKSERQSSPAQPKTNSPKP